MGGLDEHRRDFLFRSPFTSKNAGRYHGRPRTFLIFLESGRIQALGAL
jgi:hypothetical protein